MRTKSIPIPATATSLASLLDKLPRHTNQIGIQSPRANKRTIYFGDKNEQPFELVPEANALLPITSFNEVYVKGTPPDTLSIMLFDK